MWKNDDQFSSGWKLYKELKKLWPAKGEEVATDTFKIFEARYRSAEGYQRYIEELSRLLLNSCLDFLLGELDTEAKYKHLELSCTALRSRPDFSRLAWQNILSKIQEW